MFGASNPFGQSSNSPFGSPSVFGQTNNANNNPFGSTTPFGAQTGSSIFGGTSAGVFGTPASSPIGSTSVFGASSSPAFGSSTSAFGATSSPAFGAASSSPFGGSSAFGQKPAFGAFGSTPTSSPFGQSQSAFGSNPFGSSQSTFGVSSTPTFGVSSTPAFGSASTPAFGSASTPAFGSASTPVFGNTSASTFDNTGSAFGVSNCPFGSITSAFGAPSTPAFGVSAAPAFGAPSAPAFGSSPTTTFGTGSAFGQSTSAFGSSQFGAQSSPFGSQATTPAFGTPNNFAQTSFVSQQRAGSRATPYAQTPEADAGTSTQPAGKLESISAMPAYKEKRHEELRWEDYQAGDKGGPNPAGQSSGGMGFNTNNTQPTLFSSSPSFTQPAANPFSSTPSTNQFAPKTSTFGTPGFPSSTPTLNSSPFGAPTNNPFGTTQAQTTPSPSSFGTGMNFGTQSASLFQSSSPALGQPGSAFGQPGQTGSAFGQSAPAFGQPNAFSGNMFSSTPSLQNTSNLGFNQTPSSAPFQSTQPTQNSGFGFGAPAGGTSSIFGQNNNFGQMTTNQSPALAQPQSISNPFGTLPAMPQMSIGRVGNAPSVQYGISSLPVVDETRLEDDGVPCDEQLGGWVPFDEQFGANEVVDSICGKEAQSRAVDTIGYLPVNIDNVLFVCQLNPVTEVEGLKSKFSRFGTVKYVVIIRDFKIQDGLCYAFIVFEKDKDCKQACKKMDNALIDGKSIHVDHSRTVTRIWNQFISKDKYPGKNCFKCGSPYHIARDCTRRDDGFTRKGGNDSSRFHDEDLEHLVKRLMGRQRLKDITDEEVIRETKILSHSLDPSPPPRSLLQKRDFTLENYGYKISPIDEGVNCVLASVSHQFFLDQDQYDLVRRIAVAQLRTRGELYKTTPSMIYTNQEYEKVLRDCSDFECPTPLVALYAIADVFQVQFAVMKFNPEFDSLKYYSPRDPRIEASRAFHLCVTTECRNGKDFLHCDSLLSRHKNHEPVKIPESVLLWMKSYDLLILKDRKLLQLCSPPKAISQKHAIEYEKGKKYQARKEPEAKLQKERDMKMVVATSLDGEQYPTLKNDDPSRSRSGRSPVRTVSTIAQKVSRSVPYDKKAGQQKGRHSSRSPQRSSFRSSRFVHAQGSYHDRGGRSPLRRTVSAIAQKVTRSVLDDTKAGQQKRKYSSRSPHRSSVRSSRFVHAQGSYHDRYSRRSRSVTPDRNGRPRYWRRSRSRSITPNRNGRHSQSPTNRYWTRRVSSSRRQDP